MQGFRLAFLIAVGAVLVGLALAAFLPSRRHAGRLGLPASGPDKAGEADEAAADAAPMAGLHGRVRDDEGVPVA